MHPSSRPVPEWHSQPTTQKRLRIFQRWLCRKIQLLLRLQSTYTDLDVHVIMITQCFDVGNTDVQLWKENSLTHLLDFDL